MELHSVAKSICRGVDLMHVAVLKKLRLSSKKQFLSRGKQKLTYKTERIVIIDCFIPRISAVAHKGHVDFLVASY